MKPIALALAQQARGGHRMGAHTVACDEAGGVGGAPQKHRPMIATLGKEEPMTPRAERKSVTPRPSLIVVYEVIGFLAIIALSWLNELLGLPRLLFGSEHQGGWWHESLLETTIILVVAVPVVLLTRRLATRLHYLEEFLRLCAWCRKLHLDNEWVPVEEFLQRKFDSRTSHGICPACKAELRKDQMAKRAS